MRIQEGIVFHNHSRVPPGDRLSHFSISRNPSLSLSPLLERLALWLIWKWIAALLLQRRRGCLFGKRICTPLWQKGLAESDEEHVMYQNDKPAFSSPAHRRSPIAGSPTGSTSTTSSTSSSPSKTRKTGAFKFLFFTTFRCGGRLSCQGAGLPRSRFPVRGWVSLPVCRRFWR